jgi:hypothetical protein
MAMKQFVAMSDEDLYRTEGLPGPLVPYQCGVFCWHQLREEAVTSPRSNLPYADAAHSGSDGLTLRV